MSSNLSKRQIDDFITNNYDLITTKIRRIIKPHRITHNFDDVLSFIYEAALKSVSRPDISDEARINWIVYKANGLAIQNGEKYIAKLKKKTRINNTNFKRRKNGRTDLITADDIAGLEYPLHREFRYTLKYNHQNNVDNEDAARFVLSKVDDYFPVDSGRKDTRRNNVLLRIILKHFYIPLIYHYGEPMTRQELGQYIKRRLKLKATKNQLSKKVSEYLLMDSVKRFLKFYAEEINV